MIFLSLDDMIRYDGTTDQWGMTWDFKSYYKAAELYDLILKCYPWDKNLVDPVDTKTKRTRPKTPVTPEPPPPPEPTPQQPPPPANPADGFTQEDADALKTCWEEKAINLRSQKKIEGYKPKDLVSISRGSGAIWKNVSGRIGAIAYTIPDVQTIDGKKHLSINVELWTDGITAEIQKYPGMHFQYNHLATYGQMQETFHVAQVKKLFDDENREPHPYEYWEMEVDSHVGAKDLWAAIYSDPPPTYLPNEEYAMPEEYQKMAKKYKDLKKKEEDGTITEKEKDDLKQLTNDLRDPANLPQADGNEWYNPATDLECKLEDDD